MSQSKYTTKHLKNNTLIILLKKLKTKLTNLIDSY